MYRFILLLVTVPCAYTAFDRDVFLTRAYSTVQKQSQEEKSLIRQKGDDSLPYCPEYEQYCSNGLVPLYCRKTCGLKDFDTEVEKVEGQAATYKIQPRMGSSCEDRVTSCSSYKLYCYVKNVKTYCQKTCNLCSIVDGGYSSWSTYSACTKTCGSGTETRTRYCNNPYPAFGGKDCSSYGKDTESRTCIMQECPKAIILPTIPASYDCTDDHWQCPSKVSHCKGTGRMLGFMQQHCKLLCGFCRKPAPCGEAPARKQENQKPIVDGTDTTKGYYPWQVGIYYEDYGDLAFHCGGSLIDETHVLSAAHCFHELDDQIDKFTFVLGEYNRNFDEGTEQTLNATNITLHKGYDGKGSIRDDIAIITLSEKAKLSNEISPICLPKEGEERKTNSICHITGWGKQFVSGDAYHILQEVDVPVVSQEKCRQRNSEKQVVKQSDNAKLVTDNMICTGFDDGRTFKSACHGDSGGPLSCKDDEGMWKVYGVVSWGSTTCNGLSKYNVFTKTSAYIKWIKDNLV